MIQKLWALVIVCEGFLKIKARNSRLLSSGNSYWECESLLLNLPSGCTQQFLVSNNVILLSLPLSWHAVIFNNFFEECEFFVLYVVFLNQFWWRGGKLEFDLRLRRVRLSVAYLMRSFSQSHRKLMSLYSIGFSSAG